MPADYHSTARALSLSVSDSEEQESPLFAGIRPPWSQSPLSSRRLSMGEAVSFRDQIINQAKSVSRAVRNRWDKMTLTQRTLAGVGLLLSVAAGVAFMILAGQIFIWLGPVAEKWERSPLAYIVVWLLIIVVSFPPVVGWATLGTIAGFLFGLWKGWVVYATASVIGSTMSFIVCRTVLSGFVHRMLENDKRFAALALTLKYDGLKLLCMIRLCPLPYSLCNGAISTFPTVQPLSYGLATALIAPKFMIHAFIGSRIRLLSENEEMSAGSKAVNIISIIISIAIGVGTGIYIYRRTLARAKELEAQERAGIRQSIQDDHAAGRPHGGFSDDPDVNAAASTLARDEEDQLGFHDFDEDNIDLIVEGDDLNEQQLRGTKQYRDEFTDNDSDVFGDGDGEDSETYGLHTHVRE